MVQSTRLRDKIHPILPIIVVILLGLFLVFFALPTLFQRLSSDYDEYLSRRSGCSNQYNALLESLNSVLEYKYVSKDQYLDGLNRSNEIILEIKDVLSESSKMSLAILEKKMSADKVDDIEKDLATQSDLLKKIIIVEDQIKLKIQAINRIESIQNLTYCLKSVKNKYDLQQCEYISESITSPAVLTSSYKRDIIYIFVNYFDISKAQRVRKINNIIQEHNKMNSNLEKIINSTIVY